MCSLSFVNAQDTIHKIDGNIVVGKITEINNSDVKFKMYNSDISVTESKSNIHHIVYTNGLKEFYNTSTGTRYTAPETTTMYTPMAASTVSEKKYGHNIISLNFLKPSLLILVFPMNEYCQKEISLLKFQFPLV